MASPDRYWVGQQDVLQIFYSGQPQGLSALGGQRLPLLGPSRSRTFRSGTLGAMGHIPSDRGRPLLNCLPAGNKQSTETAINDEGVRVQVYVAAKCSYSGSNGWKTLNPLINADLYARLPEIHT